MIISTFERWKEKVVQPPTPTHEELLALDAEVRKHLHFQAWASKGPKINFTPSWSLTSKLCPRPEHKTASWILTYAFSLIHSHSFKVEENQKTKILIQVWKSDPQNKKFPFFSRTISQFTTHTWVCRDFNVSATGFFPQRSTLSRTEWLPGQFQSGFQYFGQEDSCSRIFISFSSQLQFLHPTDITGSHKFFWFFLFVWRVWCPWETNWKAINIRPSVNYT